MKKLSFLFLSLLAISLLTACTKDTDEPVNKQTVSATINCRAYDGSTVMFSQSTAKVELNYTDMTIQITTDYKDIDGMGHTLTTKPMHMDQRTGTTIYSFHEMTEIGSSSGYLDMATGMMLFTFTPEVGSTNYCCSTHLLYAYAKTTITNPDNGFTYNNEQTAYLFEPNASGETCRLRMSNFTPNTAGSILSSEIQYEGLTMTPTAEGYTVTASEIESTSYKGVYNITDLNFTLTNQGNVINGTFKCNGLDFKVTGNLFPIN